MTYVSVYVSCKYYYFMYKLLSAYIHFVRVTCDPFLLLFACREGTAGCGDEIGILREICVTLVATLIFEICIL